MDFPTISEQLLRALEVRFPDRAPELTTPDREVWAQAGEARLIRFLRAKFDEQSETITRKNP
ncbi:MAG: hypothetical protein J0I48_10555 [Devosia sp.]|uniref:hypothetical protein n=1 Tax=Devosia sp. 66-22 TaxID=1895753 RepID=UPI0009289D53|nr:hypothetical protein [Devosia sp. 66-22]MBN9346621.1 hypothetical protein [Devosia sp.]OJX54721.1 MAG: hypothetical protein BGO81_16510 [Devosia sp. 66-22]